MVPLSSALTRLLIVNTTIRLLAINPLSANFTKCLNTLKQFVGNLPTNFLSVFDDFVGLALKGLTITPSSFLAHSIFQTFFEFCCRDLKSWDTTKLF